VLILADCIEKMRDLDDASIDAICCAPIATAARDTLTPP
jgi:hypothetical protein